MTARSSTVQAETKRKVPERLIDLLFEKARESKLWRCGDQVYETKDAGAPLMTMREFVYYAISPLDQNLELAALLFHRRRTDVDAAAVLALYPDHVRFPVRTQAAPFAS